MSNNLYPSVNKITHRDIVVATATTADCINWLKQHGLLNTHKDCPACGQPMREIEKKNLTDGIIWSCGRPCRKNVSIRKGTFLENSKLKCQQIVDILYFWANESLAKGISQECGIAKEAVADWCNFCRGICAEYYVAQNIQIGGPNRIVEIYESAFVRRKFNVGYEIKTQWVFGALERDTRRSILVAVVDRTADTLLAIIQDRILPGTTIISDLWRSYDTLNQPGYQNLTANHSMNFVDPVTFATTNHIECLLEHVKNCDRRDLIEFMWRYEFKDEIFEKLLEHIRNHYPCY